MFYLLWFEKSMEFKLMDCIYLIHRWSKVKPILFHYIWKQFQWTLIINKYVFIYYYYNNIFYSINKLKCILSYNNLGGLIFRLYL